MAYAIRYKFSNDRLIIIQCIYSSLEQYFIIIRVSIRLYSKLQNYNRVMNLPIQCKNSVLSDF